MRLMLESVFLVLYFFSYSLLFFVKYVVLQKQQTCLLKKKVM